MRLTHTGCYGCIYNDNTFSICRKDGDCTGKTPYPTSASTTSAPTYVSNCTRPANTSVMPDEIEINGVKYRKVEK